MQLRDLHHESVDDALRRLTAGPEVQSVSRHALLSTKRESIHRRFPGGSPRLRAEKDVAVAHAEFPIRLPHS